MKIVFATNNKNKLKEVQALVSNFELLSLQDIQCLEDIPETSDSIEGNSKLKADYVTKKYDMACFADDTGLEINALNGAPGVYSARYAGPGNDAEKNMQKVLNELKETSNRTAQFKTVITLNLNGQQHVFEGICKGTILKEKTGQEGFGYDPIFQPEGFSKSFSEMNMEEKGAISHRGLAVKKLISFLNKLA
ncbi:non-canonical purine NTP diphosphatase [Flavicella sediminum]|uniref:non-canonical purine NTP diphosphatase n=1 Tax=Flavicella sediminum TaxID=2585141 RepID=UPI001122EF2C|nr:non-canonical purine NTP diphosphatase [Flavicella sediminum]